MNRSLIIAGVLGICLGAASPVIYRTVTARSAAEPGAAATVSTSSEGSGGTYEVATAATPTLPSTAPAAETTPQAAAPTTAPNQDQAYEEAVREVAAENAKLKANRDAYYDHTAEVRKESNEHYRQLQQQGNIRAQENLAAAKLQERKDEAAEAEYNNESGGYWNNWSAGDWNHVNRWSNGYLWRP